MTVHVVLKENQDELVNFCVENMEGGFWLQTGR